MVTIWKRIQEMQVAVTPQALLVQLAYLLAPACHCFHAEAPITIAHRHSLFHPVYLPEQTQRKMTYTYYADVTAEAWHLR